MKKRYSIPQWILLGIVVALVALHLALPLLVRNYLNDKLADMGDYRGHIGDVDLVCQLGIFGSPFCIHMPRADILILTLEHPVQSGLFCT